MSGEDVKAYAGVARARVTAHEVERVSVRETIERDGRDRVTLTRPGRREGTTTIENDEQIMVVIRGMRRRGVETVTMETVAANSGDTGRAFTYSNLRYYLRTRGRTFRELAARD